MECGDGLNGICATNRLWCCFGHPEVFHLALLNQLFHGSGNVFDGHVGVDAVLIEQIDDIGLEALERGGGDFLDVLWPTVQAGLFAGGRINFEAELGGDHYLVAERSEGFADEFFVCERAVDFGGVEEGDTAFYGRADERDAFLLVDGGAETETQSHAAEP